MVPLLPPTTAFVIVVFPPSLPAPACRQPGKVEADDFALSLHALLKRSAHPMIHVHRMGCSVNTERNVVTFQGIGATR